MINQTMLFTYADQVMSWYISGREKELSKLFVERGFDALREELKIEKDEEWEVIFDNFIVYSGLLLTLVIKNAEFFLDILLREGSGKVREVLQIEDEKYNGVFRVILDALLDGFCKRKYKEKRLETLSKTLDQILEVLRKHGV